MNTIGAILSTSAVVAAVVWLAVEYLKLRSARRTFEMTRADIATWNPTDTSHTTASGHIVTVNRDTPPVIWRCDVAGCNRPAYWHGVDNRNRHARVCDQHPARLDDLLDRKNPRP
jgi:hypothetical protein